MIVVGGVIGSGKSTLAAELGRELAARSSAPIERGSSRPGCRSPLAPTRASTTTSERERTYAEVIRRARRGHRGRSRRRPGRDVLDPSLAPGGRGRRARGRRPTFVFIEARCPPDLLRRRLVARREQPSVSDATEPLLEPFLRTVRGRYVLDPGPCLGDRHGRSCRGSRADDALRRWRPRNPDGRGPPRIMSRLAQILRATPVGGASPAPDATARPRNSRPLAAGPAVAIPGAYDRAD